jgi:hypothetical protein
MLGGLIAAHELAVDMSRRYYERDGSTTLRVTPANLIQ